MSFNAKNLTPINVVKEGVIPSLWAFYNKDSDTVTTAGYIPYKTGIKAKDQVLVIPADGASNAWYHASVSSGVITLSANS